MATALQTLTLKAMSRASGYGEWTPSRTTGQLAGRPFGDHGGTFIDRTPRRVPLYNHDPAKEVGRVMATGSFHEEYLYEKGLKLRWYIWPPGEECMSRTFTAAWVEKLSSGANALKIGDSKQGCEFCRAEPLADAEKTPTQMTPETRFGTSGTTTVSNSTPFRDEIPLVTESRGPDKMVMGTPQEWSLEELQAELTRRQAEAEATAPALTDESRAAVESVGAPTEPTATMPSVPVHTAPPAATKPRLTECPGCQKQGKGGSAKKRSSSVYAHLRSNPDHADTAEAVPA